MSGSLPRSSLDSNHSFSTSPPLNGHGNDDDPLDPISRLQRELERTKEEKESLAAQHRTLLTKLTTMRATLGNKLKQDAEELDRQEQLVQQLTAQNEDLAAAVETLKRELITSNEETERVSRELDTLRSQALQENAQEALAREWELRETQTELERCKLDRDELERTALHERAIADDIRSTLENLKRDLELEVDAKERLLNELDAERERSTNLQSVLEDFQSAKDHELREAVKDLEVKLNRTIDSLAEYKHRALTAESQLDEVRDDTTRVQELEKGVKEKDILLQKLQHEAVILNEHLMEALRRLRRNSSETNVDRRLVTNVLLSFLSTPRADTKRYEMLSLLASILSWNDQERERAGLQRTQSVNSLSSFWGRSPSSGAFSPTKTAELEKTDETESFSRLWVEFLLTEAAAGESIPAITSPAKSNTSLPDSPSVKPTALRDIRRLPPFGHAGGMTSSPNLTLMNSSISRKGKDKEIS
ncbi:hypothetical protein AMATHDRAFT_149253 [Amanita thiersii Skay4041]|uniref:GRIP domain-containing protein n=1 Tax=Amanita thiersii Skay4041 TaxID=703135 RepID=A0A2A9NCF3_9AGAR|nr:hypothetical protein AMATHDRAFT_149253 [Amanita thiersii Skay4041]